MRLRLPVKQRLGVLVLLCLGIVVTAAGVIRTYYIWKSLIGSWDITWYAFHLWIAACVEIDLAVVSIPLYPRESRQILILPALRVCPCIEAAILVSRLQDELRHFLCHLTTSQQPPVFQRDVRCIKGESRTCRRRWRLATTKANA